MRARPARQHRPTLRESILQSCGRVGGRLALGILSLVWVTGCSTTVRTPVGMINVVDRGGRQADIIRSQNNELAGGWADFQSGNDRPLMIIPRTREGAVPEPRVDRGWGGNSAAPQTSSGIRLMRPRPVAPGHSIAPANSASLVADGAEALIHQPDSATASTYAANPIADIPATGYSQQVQSPTIAERPRTGLSDWSEEDGAGTSMRESSDRVNAAGVSAGREDLRIGDAWTPIDPQPEPETVGGFSGADMNPGVPVESDSVPELNDGAATGPLEPAGSTTQSAETPELDTDSQSLLRRLRTLTTPRLDENTGDMLRKQFRRLQSPLGLLRERESSAAPEPPLIEIPQPETMTAEAVPSNPEPVTGLASPTSPLNAAIVQLESELQTWPMQPSGQPANPSEWRRRQADLRLLYLVADRPGDAMTVIRSLPAEEQEFWQSLMLGLNHYRMAGTESESELVGMTQTVSQLHAAAAQLQPRARLTVDRLTFCSQVRSFAGYTPLPTSDFSPGQPMMLYAEIRNFGTEPTDHGTLQTTFRVVLDILRDGDDEPVESIRLPQIEDESFARRTDYFHSYELTVPSHLSSGRYAVRVRLQDAVTRQSAEATIAFHVR